MPNDNSRLGPRLQPGPATLLSRLGDARRQELLRLGAETRFDAGEVLLTEGDTSTHLFLLLTGWVKVVASVHDGRETLLAIRGSGDLVGELAALDTQPRIATVRATQVCRARRIEAAEFRAFLAVRPDVAIAVNSAVAAKLRTATRRRVDFSARSTRARVARILVEMAATCGRETAYGTDIVAPVTQPELATLVGASEATVHRVLAELHRQSLITTGYRRITVIDLPALASLEDNGDLGTPAESLVVNPRPSEQGMRAGTRQGRRSPR